MTEVWDVPYYLAPAVRAVEAGKDPGTGKKSVTIGGYKPTAIASPSPSGTGSIAKTNPIAEVFKPLADAVKTSQETVRNVGETIVSPVKEIFSGGDPKTVAPTQSASSGTSPLSLEEFSFLGFNGILGMILLMSLLERR